MILLTSTSDLLRVVTSTAGNVQVQSSYVDLSGTTVTPGRLNTLITTAATTNIVASPAASTQRNIKTVSIFNHRCKYGYRSAYGWQHDCRHSCSFASGSSRLDLHRWVWLDDLRRDSPGQHSNIQRGWHLVEAVIVHCGGCSCSSLGRRRWRRRWRFSQHDNCHKGRRWRWRRVSHRTVFPRDRPYEYGVGHHWRGRNGGRRIDCRRLWRRRRRGWQHYFRFISDWVWRRRWPRWTELCACHWRRWWWWGARCRWYGLCGGWRYGWCADDCDRACI
jgi:hypothetical protein